MLHKGQKTTSGSEGRDQTWTYVYLWLLTHKYADTAQWVRTGFSRQRWVNRTPTREKRSRRVSQRMKNPLRVDSRSKRGGENAEPLEETWGGEHLATSRPRGGQFLRKDPFVNVGPGCPGRHLRPPPPPLSPSAMPPCPTAGLTTLAPSSASGRGTWRQWCLSVPRGRLTAGAVPAFEGERKKGGQPRGGAVPPGALCEGHFKTPFPLDKGLVWSSPGVRALPPPRDLANCVCSSGW